MEEPHLSAAASLVAQLDRLLLVLLRDGKQFIGVLRSFDQFSNVVLSDAVERVVEGRQYADLHVGLFVVRGENLVLLGDLGEAAPPAGGGGGRAVAPPLAGHERVPEAAIRSAQAAARAAEALKGGMRARFDGLDLDS